MLVLIGFEASQEVCKAFREHGHEAYSCDLEPCYGGHTEWHLQMDIYEALTSRKWGFIGMHPVCTSVAVSGNATYASGKPKHWMRLDAMTNIRDLWLYVKSICNEGYLENPIGVLPYFLGKCSQIVQPWMFGHPESKQTCLWLHNLPKLKPTNILQLPLSGRWNNQTQSGQNKLGPSPDRAKIRSHTYAGIAAAMASQWTKL